jgi:hypothetical protein
VLGEIHGRRGYPLKVEVPRPRTGPTTRPGCWRSSAAAPDHFGDACGFDSGCRDRLEIAKFEPPSIPSSSGIAFAIVVLILAFGSVLAMGLPIAVALGGVGVGIGGVTTLVSNLTMPDFATIIGAMIGLGVGIDYALFIVTRYREGLHAAWIPRRRRSSRSTPPAARWSSPA